MSRKSGLPIALAFASFTLLAALCGLKVQAGKTPAVDVLYGLRPGHPRLLVRNEDLAQVREAIAQDPLVEGWHKRLRQDATKMLSQPPVEHKLIGPRLLDKSRTALRRISTLAGLYRLDGDRPFAERAVKEMLAVADFPDWNPSHFLDTAEMTNALAIGYDWLYEVLSPADRNTIRTALVEKGLREGLKIYRKGTWWSRATHNWNQVCNGGMTAGALALADEESDLAREIVDQGRTSIVLAMNSFAPDGGWAEGPGYWNYATSYNVYYLASVESALGTDFGLKKMPGFARTGDFRMHSIGPMKETFNFADAHPGAGKAPQMLWLGHAFDRRRYVQHERQITGNQPEILHLFWSRPGDNASLDEALPLDRKFGGIDVAFFRSAWDDGAAVYVGFKGGDNKTNHSHLDLGSFVLDAFGERWAHDLGPDDYNLPGYFGKQRWTYYRLRTEGHNTLTIDGANQKPSARAPLVAFYSSADRAFAVADLTEAYGTPIQEARRGLALLKRNQVLIQDEVKAGEPVEIVWNFHTMATIDIQGQRATLVQGKARRAARILSPAGARFEIVSANPSPPQGQQPDMKNLTVRLPEKTRQVRLAVLLAPADHEGPTLEGLDSWIKTSKSQK